MADTPLVLRVKPSSTYGDSVYTNRRSVKLSKKVASSLVDPALQGRWFTYVPDIQDHRQVLVEQTTIPFHKTEPTARYTEGTYRHYQGAIDIDGIQVVFYETYDYRVTKWLYEWRKKVFDPATGVYGLPKDYRREFVTEFFPTDSENPVMRKSYYGCFPIEQQPFEMTYAEIDGRITVACLFAVNKSDTDFLAQSE